MTPIACKLYLYEKINLIEVRDLEGNCLLTVESDAPLPLPRPGAVLHTISGHVFVPIIDKLISAVKTANARHDRENSIIHRQLKELVGGHTAGVAASNTIVTQPTNKQT